MSLLYNFITLLRSERLQKYVWYFNKVLKLLKLQNQLLKIRHYQTHSCPETLILGPLCFRMYQKVNQVVLGKNLCDYFFLFFIYKQKAKLNIRFSGNLTSHHIWLFDFIAQIMLSSYVLLQFSSLLHFGLRWAELLILQYIFLTLEMQNYHLPAARNSFPKVGNRLLAPRLEALVSTTSH